MTDRPQTFAEALADLGRGITDALSQAATETTFTNAATRALTACLDQDDDHAAEALDGLTDAQLYAIEGAGSALAIHASRLRKPPSGDEQDEMLGASCTGVIVDELPEWVDADEQGEPTTARLDNTAPDLTAPDLTALYQRIRAALHSLTSDGEDTGALTAAVWHELTPTLAALRDRAEAAERRADEQQQRAQRAEANTADWRTVATQHERDRDEARTAFTDATVRATRAAHRADTAEATIHRVADLAAHWRGTPHSTIAIDILAALGITDR